MQRDEDKRDNQNRKRKNFRRFNDENRDFKEKKHWEKQRKYVAKPTGSTNPTANTEIKMEEKKPDSTQPEVSDKPGKVQLQSKSHISYSNSWILLRSPTSKIL
jgi:hypothetical protein